MWANARVMGECEREIDMVVLLKNDSCIDYFSLRSFVSLVRSLFTSNGKYKYHGKRINWSLQLDEKEFSKKISTSHAADRNRFFASFLWFATLSVNERSIWEVNENELINQSEKCHVHILVNLFKMNKSVSQAKSRSASDSDRRGVRRNVY